MTQVRDQVPCNPRDQYRLNYITDVVYAKRPTRELKMRILTPMPVRQIMHGDNAFSRENMAPEFGDVAKRLRPRPHKPSEVRCPALISLMGSGFNGSAGYAGLATYTDVARAGVVMISIDYRGASLDDTRFPDAVQDVKEAVRFLKAHAEEYSIDPERIFLMGTSSGGYTVSMAGVTGDEAEFVIGENTEYSSKVRGVIDCFGPMDFTLEREDRVAIGYDVPMFCEEAYSLFRNDVVKDPSLLDQASVLKRISSEKEIPEFLILHGDEDKTVPMRQSERLYEALTAAGKSARFYTVTGAGHERYFWGEATMQLVADFVLCS